MFLSTIPLAAAALNSAPDYTFAELPMQSLLGAFAATGDRNGDGLADFSVTAQGSAQIAMFHGEANSQPDHWTYWSYVPDFGWGLAYVGDLDGDGKDEVAAASDKSVVVMLSGGDYLHIVGEVEVSAGADIDKDGFDDLVLGEPYVGSAGQVRVFPGGVAPSTTAGQILTGSGAAGFGYNVCALGDVDGDTYPDLAISQLGSGEVHVAFGSSSGLVLGQTLTGTDGFSLACTGDVDGDGFDDLAVRDTSNLLRLHSGGASGLDGGVVLSGYPATSIGRGGDITGDGFADVLLTGSGGVYLFEGSASGLETSSDAILPDPVGGNFGYVALGLDDVNGDGFGDVLVTAPQYANDNGWIGVWYGYEVQDTGLEELEDPGDGPIDGEGPGGGGCSAAPAAGGSLLALLGLLGLRRRR